MKIQQKNNQRLTYQLPIGIGIFLAAIFFFYPSTDKLEQANQLAKTTTIACTNPTEIGGAIFDDLNNNGIQESENGIAGVSVSLFDDNGQVGIPQTTNSSGEYLFTELSEGKKYRIEISLPAGYEESIYGSDSKTRIQFAQSGSCGNSLGLVDVLNYCEGDPYIIVPCYVDGEFNGPLRNYAAVAKVKESADGHDFDPGAIKNSNFEASKIASHLQVGSVYGLAWQPKRQRYFATAFHKRYVDYGPNGPDAIYQLDIGGNVQGVIELDNLLPGSNTAGADVHNWTSTGGELYDLGSGDVSLDAVGKRAFGDAELSDNGSTLYIVNLYDRNIYALDVSGENASDATLLNSWSTPDATAANRHRPFGLAFHQGKLWIGSVDENGSNAYVHSLDPSGSNFTLELTIPLNYDRQSYAGGAQSTTTLSNWRAWITNTTTDYMITNNTDKDIGYPQAILTDIEFAENGDMILGFRDRFGDQSGSDAIYRSADAASLGGTYGVSAGDLLKACYINGTYVLESGVSGTCGPSLGSETNSGPGGVEFYHWDIYTGYWQVPWNPNNSNKAFHWETAQGGLIQPKNKDYVISTHMNPFNDYGGGFVKHSNTTGKRVGVGEGDTALIENLGGGYTLFDNGDHNASTGPPAGSNFFGKANGLGDLELACPAPQIEIGTYIWIDKDKDGIQDPSEYAVAGLQVNLLNASGTVIATAPTNEKGEVYFNDSNVTLNGANGIEYYTNYSLQVPNASGSNQQSAFYGYELTLANQGSSDEIDSDASMNGINAEISISTNDFNASKHSFDLGLSPLDSDRDGIADIDDIDDDNDGLPDIEEGGVCAGNIDYEFYNTVPAGNSVYNIPTSGPTASGHTNEINVDNIANLHTPGDLQSFSIRYTGRIFIANDDLYTFYLSSDDGSRLVIGGEEIVINDGLHGNIERSGSISLLGGYYDFEITFFENTGAEILTWSYSSASISKRLVPMSILFPTNCGGVDTDQDGIDNHLDLDSDNDGIPDLIEAGGIDSNGNGRIDDATDTDGDGLLDSYDTHDADGPLVSGCEIRVDCDLSSSTSLLLDPNGDGTNEENGDFDGDGLANWIDLDSDDDGILDIIEAGGVDNNGDGTADNTTDADEDGYADVYDPNADDGPGTEGSNGSPRMTTSKDGGDSDSRPEYQGVGGLGDSDGDDVPDFLDVDSDNDGIYDLYEAQGSNAVIIPTATDDDGDGIDNAYDDNDSNWGGAGLSPINTDSGVDMTPDYLDIDSDGDQFPDIHEAWDSNTDADSEPDGATQGCELDNDGDGYVDCFDSDDLNKQIWTTNLTPPNDDGTGGEISSVGVDITVDNNLDDIFPNNASGSRDDEPDWRDYGTTFPVEWLDFEAVKRGKDALVNWSTAAEINADYFDVERSVDGLSFQRVGRTEAVGNTQRVSKYSFRDAGAIDNRDDALYYRLKQVDENGITLKAPLIPNINHRSTVFGGSVSALAILAGWTLVHVNLQGLSLSSRIVIQRNSIEYLQPIDGDFIAVCPFPSV
ncbi:MAG: YiiD C-terminal domain-containing protein, partial [Bacteroidota bacterium]